ncbi:MAG: VWA domain-containing protein [Vicinamibacterales bacterium]|mgnify:CR=1 FL=1
MTWLVAGDWLRATPSHGLIAAVIVSSAAVGVLQARQEPVFRAQTRLVVLRATVKNSRGVIVAGLDSTAFTVYENGKPQPITLFRRDDVPVSIGLLIDNSRSIRLLRRKIEAAAVAFVRASNPDDEFFVLNFADKPRVDVPFTRDAATLEARIARVDSIGGTALYDAVAMAQGYLREHAAHDRRALLIISDGHDNASEVSKERLRRQAELDDVAIYAVGLSEPGDEGKRTRDTARKELDDLTEGTGGLLTFPSSIEAINAVVLEMAHQIRSQYTIGYTPVNQALDGSYRSIKVTVAGPERLVVRTRTGYRATAAVAPQ